MWWINHREKHRRAETFAASSTRGTGSELGRLAAATPKTSTALPSQDLAPTKPIGADVSAAEGDRILIRLT
jgi:hypothetical protein